MNSSECISRRLSARVVLGSRVNQVYKVEEVADEHAYTKEGSSEPRRGEQLDM